MRTRILASGDNHWHEHTRFDECARVHRWMVNLARDASVDLYLNSGDVYEATSTPREREAVAEEWLIPMGEICPVVLVRGNHDAPKDCALLGKLRTKNRIVVEERADVHVVRGVAVAAFAWPETSFLTSRAVSVGQADADVRAALRDVFRGLGSKVRGHDGPRVALGHAMIDGSVASTNQPLLGMPINVSLEELMLIGASLGLYGHIHRGQWWDGIDGSRHGYVGSPFRTAFGQLEPKTVTIAEFEGSRLLSVEQVETPAAKMALLEYDWTGGRLVRREGDGFDGDALNTEIRVRYHVPVDQQEAASAAAEELAKRFHLQGATSVKPEPQVVTEKRARAPEVAAASTLVEKLTAHWDAVGFDPGERRAALLEKAHRLEEETRDA